MNRADWGWILLVAGLVLAAIVLLALKGFGLIAMPWWAALVPVYLLVALVGWALVSADRLMKSNGWN